jgi:hypothetical protein
VVEEARLRGRGKAAGVKETTDDEVQGQDDRWWQTKMVLEGRCPTIDHGWCG